MPEATPPRVSVTFTWGTGTEVTLTRRDTDVSRPVRGAEPLTVTASQAVTVVDFEAPFGVPVRYQAVGADGTSAVGETVTLDPSAWYPNDQDWTTSRGAVWLRHLTRPTLSMPVDLVNAESPVFKQTRTVVDVLDRRTPIVLTDSRRKQLTSTVDIRTWSLEEAARLRELCADNTVLLLSVPAAERWGLTQWYVAVGDLTEERLWQEWAPFEGRVFHLPVEVVDRPAGGVVYPACCYATALNTLVSYLDVLAAWPNYASFAACTAVDADPGTGGGGGGGGLVYVQVAGDSYSDNLGSIDAPTVTMSAQFTVTAGTTYTVQSGQYVRGTGADVQLRYQYGSQVGTSIGLPFGSSDVQAADDADLLVATVGGDLTPDTDGLVTVVFVLTPTGTVTDATDETYTRYLHIGTMVEQP